MLSTLTTSYQHSQMVSASTLQSWRAQILVLKRSYIHKWILLEMDETERAKNGGHHRRKVERVKRHFLGTICALLLECA